MEPKTIGILLAFVAAFCWACANVFIRRASLMLDPFIGVYWTLWINLACALIALIFFVGGSDLLHPGWTAIGIFGLIGLIQYPIARLSYYVSIRYIGTTRATGITSFQAIFTAVLATWILREVITSRIALGTVLTVVGVYVIITEKRASG